MTQRPKSPVQPMATTSGNKPRDPEKYLSGATSAYLRDGEGYGSDGEPLAYSQPRDWFLPTAHNDSDLDTDAEDPKKDSEEAEGEYCTKYCSYTC